jgi:outer membrane murein-binding lipoprotein Lpp
MIKLSNGFHLTYSARSDKRISDVSLLDGRFYVTAKSAKLADQLASEAQAWGAKVEQLGRDLIVWG